VTCEKCRVTGQTKSKPVARPVPSTVTLTCHVSPFTRYPTENG
jgi:hypothetical protein